MGERGEGGEGREAHRVVGRGGGPAVEKRSAAPVVPVIGKGRMRRAVCWLIYFANGHNEEAPTRRRAKAKPGMRG